MSNAEPLRLHCDETPSDYIEVKDTNDIDPAVAHLSVTESGGYTACVLLSPTDAVRLANKLLDLAGQPAATSPG